MRKYIFAAAILAAFCFTANKQASAQELGFYIVNNTGVTLNNIYVSPAESANWGNDILPQSMFDSGTKVLVHIPATYGQTCMFDIKITDVPGNAVIFKNVDACKLHTLSIHWDGTWEMVNE